MTTSFNNRLSIIFDLGGVLFDWDPAYLYLKYFDGDQQAVDRFLEEIQFTEWNLRQDRGRPWPVAISEHCERFPQYCHLIRAYYDEYEESIRGPIQGSVEILQALWEAGEPLYALSNWSEEKFELIRPRYGFFEYFQKILISGSLGCIKPDRRIFELLLQAIGREAEGCLMIDDSAANIQAAQSLGFRTIHFKSPEQLRFELRRIGVGNLSGPSSRSDGRGA